MAIEHAASCTRDTYVMGNRWKNMVAKQLGNVGNVVKDL